MCACVYVCVCVLCTRLHKSQHECSRTSETTPVGNSRVQNSMCVFLFRLFDCESAQRVRDPTTTKPHGCWLPAAGWRPLPLALAGYRRCRRLLVVLRLSGPTNRLAYNNEQCCACFVFEHLGACKRTICVWPAQHRSRRRRRAQTTRIVTFA